MKDNHIKEQINQSAERIANTVNTEGKMIAFSILQKLEYKIRQISADLFNKQSEKMLEITNKEEKTD